MMSACKMRVANFRPCGNRGINQGHVPSGRHVGAVALANRAAGQWKNPLALTALRHPGRSAANPSSIAETAARSGGDKPLSAATRSRSLPARSFGWYMTLSSILLPMRSGTLDRCGQPATILSNGTVCSGPLCKGKTLNVRHYETCHGDGRMALHRPACQRIFGPFEIEVRLSHSLRSDAREG